MRFFYKDKHGYPYIAVSEDYSFQLQLEFDWRYLFSLSGVYFRPLSIVFDWSRAVSRLDVQFVILGVGLSIYYSKADEEMQERWKKSMEETEEEFRLYDDLVKKSIDQYSWSRPLLGTDEQYYFCWYCGSCWEHEEDEHHPPNCEHERALKLREGGVV